MVLGLLVVQLLLLTTERFSAKAETVAVTLKVLANQAAMVWR
jgi:hypothetical protein